MRSRYDCRAFRAIAARPTRSYLGIDGGNVGRVVRGLNEPTHKEPRQAKLFTKIRHWNDKHLTRGELARMDQRLLTDFGMIRGDIDRGAARSFLCAANLMI